MKFQDSPYEINLYRNAETDRFILSLSINGFHLLSIKMDGDYLVSLFGFLEQLYADTIPFGITFPISNGMMVYSLSCEYYKDDYYRLIIEEINIKSQSKVYEILIKESEELSEFLDLFDEYATEYMTDDQLSDLANSVPDLEGILLKRGAVFR